MKCVGCPRCKGRLEQVIYRDIEIDRCLDCSGIWFDSMEAEWLKRLEGSETVDVGRAGAGERHPRTSCCPRCRQQMLRMLDIDKHAVWYEKCNRCQGIWLEAGQFTRFKQNFAKKGVLDRAKQVFNPRG